MNRQLLAFDVTTSKAVVAAIGACLGPWIEALYGTGRIAPISVLLVAILLDWITGIAASHKDKTYSSEYGRRGVYRTLYLLVFPVLANGLDRMLETPGLLFYGITFALIYHTWQSLTANAERAGWGAIIPGWASKMVESELQAKIQRADDRRQGVDEADASKTSE
ncbi:phage holin family protein [Paenibacillus lycopersici]|uniref:Phage holin family protein n=1 Tax=Paenibacillus lycopersici TaxID=2704462 RepID=A0A6C0FYD8_9BACL|nr:phage holin family protein [Paenibacillus lycopersici]QHT61687.1 phage holin family protein [Paenibacillus lycopersici]